MSEPDADAPVSAIDEPQDAAEQGSANGTTVVHAAEDFGEPCTVIYEDFDNGEPKQITNNGSAWTLSTDEAGKCQVKLVTVRGSGDIRDLWIQRLPIPPSTESAKTVLHLSGSDARRLVDLMNNLAFVSVIGQKQTTPLEERFAQVVVADPAALKDVYQHDPEQLRALIVNDESARDVVAIAYRRSQVEEFRRLLTDNDYFDQATKDRHGPESVWQNFIERNPWILGVSLSRQLLTGWDADRLEQTVVGMSIAGPGKRADAVLRTAGRVRSMAFVELKHHRTALLGKEYRHGCWAPSDELVGAVAQSQGTVQYALRGLGDHLPDHDENGADIPGEFTYLFRPRSYVIAGRLDEFVSESGGHYKQKIQSFELYRRHTDQPEIITFDELLARAEWLADAEAN